MDKDTTDDDRALLAELGLDAAPAPVAARSAREERIIAGFAEIERFVADHGRRPQHGDDRDIFERLYAVRLDRLRTSTECRTLLAPLDTGGLLQVDIAPALPPADALDDDALLAALGIDPTAGNAITTLTHVRSRGAINAAEEIAQRTPCLDFAAVKPAFEQVQRELATGDQQAVKYQDNAAVNAGDWFILDGQKVLVAAMGTPFTSDHGRQDRRLRVIYDNATESDLLLRSLQRALNKDKTSRRIVSTDLGPLFAHIEAEADLPSGAIYVLRSQSDDPFIAEHRSVIHKIGVTGGDVARRIANARHDPTYLLADVTIVATFTLSAINPRKLEALLHRFFASARLELALPDRFGTLVQPREWFLVPLEAIEAVIDHIAADTLDQFRYDPKHGQLVRV